MKTKIVCAFPAMGKTHYHKEHSDTTLDSDSSEYSWIIFNDGKRMRNSKFPANYIAHIKEQFESGKYEYIFVSTHKEVTAGLLEAGLPFTLIMPAENMKGEILKRMRERRSPETLISIINDNYDTFINDMNNVNPIYNTDIDPTMVEVITTTGYVRDIIEEVGSDD